MPTPLHVLILEDRPADAELMAYELAHAGFNPRWECAQTEETFTALLSPELDLILADYSLPNFDALRALQRVRERNLDIPFIVVSGTIGEDTAVVSIKKGATDYVLKDRLARLGPAVTRALEEKQLRLEKQRSEQALRESEQRFRLIAENARDLISITDSLGRYTYVSPSHEVVLGYSVESLLGLQMADLVHPDDRLQMAHSPNARVEFRAHCSDGKWVWLEGSSQTIDWQGQPLHVAIARDITERKNAEEEIRRLFEQVRNGRERLQALSQQLLRAQETERRSIARELHDQIGQALTGVQLNLQAIEPLLSPTSAHAILADTMVTIEQTLQQVRDLSLNLRPSVLDDFGLVSALKWLVTRQAPRAAIPIELHAEPLENRPPIEIETACFRVVQEALTNALRHAEASRIDVELHGNARELQLVVCDNGKGFDTQAALARAVGGGSFGLLGMQERVVTAGGRIEIHSVPRRGTEVCAHFTLPVTGDPIERRVERRESQ